MNLYIGLPIDALNAVLKELNKEYLFASAEQQKDIWQQTRQVQAALADKFCCVAGEGSVYAS